ncbi:DmpA family aminopeptidase [Salinibacillus xinjiangensis]|uniref:S58 family peptidase n=1 Tax=Salinibacillus xinjiangensis TaxID=1229268 RepID=A0A6G1X3Q4_9BACI|nr:P1 family peptidase [Salinibacillus xinjiangensis]MRG85621.1 S58 family peptidase [Salinibacillus xinjiangensis]
MRNRIRELGITVGSFPTGKRNMITDVPGVQVGNVTLKEDLPNEECIRTGVTAILPHTGNVFQDKVPAASFVLNGFGKTTGLIQVEELGVIESPIMLTNTFNVGTVLQGTHNYILENNSDIGDQTGSLNVVVGECNDMYLNSVKKVPIREEHARKAITNASSEVEEGAVGAGTGMMCYQYKGGVGTASRLVRDNYTIGVLVVSNFGRREEFEWGHYQPTKMNDEEVPDGSIMMVVATDAPVTDRQLKRIAKRAPVGLARTGSRVHHGSGDIVIAFTNGYTIPHNVKGEYQAKQVHIRDDSKIMNELFQGVAEATEEAILNSLTKAETTSGRKGRVLEGIPYDSFKAFTD